jgi:transcription-repair coupling factor (superfamily II helicase)
MLAEEVAGLRGEAPPARVEPALVLRLPARLPSSWIDDPGLRFSVLRKIAAAREAGAVADLRRELADRFGPPPREAAHLLDLADLKARCRGAGVARIEEPADRRYRVVFAEEARPPGAVLDALAARSGEQVRPLPGIGFEADFPKRSWEEVLRALGRLLALATGGKR